MTTQAELPSGIGALPTGEAGPAPAEFQRSFLKWAGGKFQILRAVLEALPAGTRLVEPFAGSGVVFLNAGFPENLVCDSNDALIDTFAAIQEHPAKFCAEAGRLFRPENNRAEAFYALRDEFNSTPDRFRRSLLFVYLNRHCFNGLCRFNRRGRFNVPFGRYRSPQFPEREIRQFAVHAKAARFCCQDFIRTMRACAPGDVVYCDPPYVPLSKTASFTSYGTLDFSTELQASLAQEAGELARRGVPVVISNHDTELTRRLYSGADELRSIEVQRFISCDGGNRGKARELIAIYRPR